ncbi:hypothetical protein LshimejAT787_0105980 [Lyophyllum shimeji]|uniref:Zn(2)-C6 fungal-type domain-containing protein n=1 Tax=Lyophyllum shimeji TaxID=47721 RepID=A0A9P3UHD4_LYOSH|nr:hypothetical protein LshimejAT787_0105980 [Lyophyllum shimeji]
MACKSCRKRKVKCLPLDEQPGRRCERCMTEGLECRYVSVADDNSPARGQVPPLTQGSFDAGNTGTSSPDGAAQGVLGDTHQWPHTLQNNSAYAAAPRQAFDVSGSANNTSSVGRVDILPYGTSSGYEEDYQQRLEDTHDGGHAVSVSHAVDPWPGQVHQGSHLYQDYDISPIQYASSSTTNFIGHTGGLITPIASTPRQVPCHPSFCTFSQASSSSWLHIDGACPYPHYCNICIQAQRPYF